MKLIANHTDTCLPDYFGGDSRPYIQMLAVPNMTISEIQSALKTELLQGAIGGSLDYEIVESDLFYHMADIAIEEMCKQATEQNGKGFKYFSDIEQSDDEFADAVYAFFVFTY